MIRPRLCPALLPLLILFSTTGAVAQPAFLYEWGSSGTATGEFDSPAGIAMIEGGGFVYVTDENNHRVQRFDEFGVFLGSWGSFGAGDGQFNRPSGVAVDGWGDVYVADTANHRIQKFDDAGNYLGQWGGLGSGQGQFNSPQDIDATLSNEVYVVDTGNHRVQVFDVSGGFLREWGSMGSGNGQFQDPKGIKLAGLRVLVSDTGNQRVQVFDTTGGFDFLFGTPGSTLGQFLDIRGLTFDCRGDIYVADAARARILHFDGSGGFIEEWGTPGSGTGQFRGPRDVALRPPSGIVGKRRFNGPILVADTLNDRVQAFEGPCCGGGFEVFATATSLSGPVFITPAGTGETFASENVVVDIEILDICGDPIPGYPFQDIIVGDNAGFTEISICNGGSVADANTDANGQTQFSGAIAGGGHTQNGLQVYLAGVPINGPALLIDLVSTDLNGDLQVDLTDLGDFAVDFGNGVYDFRSDLTHDGAENLGDVGRLAIHMGDACP